MEKLEKKISEWCETNSTNGGNISFDIEVNKNLSWDNEQLVKVSDIMNYFPHEVTDIAIAFAAYAASQWPRLTDEELFSDFITNYYK